MISYDLKEFTNHSKAIIYNENDIIRHDMSMIKNLLVLTFGT